MECTTINIHTKVRFKIREIYCKICDNLVSLPKIFHLEILLTWRNLISSHDLIRNATFFGEKMKSENLALLEKHVILYKDWVQKKAEPSLSSNM